jgi:polyhydroxyalkanoate synthesis regulator phasin
MFVPDDRFAEGVFFMKVNDDVRKVMMAGIGALSAVAEKTQDVIEALAKKGEEALENGQVLNEKLRHKISKALEQDEWKVKKTPDKKAVLDALDSLTPDELKEVKEKIKSLRHNDD